MSTQECFDKDYATLELALFPFVVWEPFPHPGDDTPPQLLSMYKNLTEYGYANGLL